MLTSVAHETTPDVIREEDARQNPGAELDEDPPRRAEASRSAGTSTSAAGAGPGCGPAGPAAHFAWKPGGTETHLHRSSAGAGTPQGPSAARRASPRGVESCPAVKEEEAPSRGT